MLDASAVLESLDGLDLDDAEAVRLFDAMAFAYFNRDTLHTYRPGYVVVKVQTDAGGPVQLVAFTDKFPRFAGLPDTRAHLITLALKRGEKL